MARLGPSIAALALSALVIAACAAGPQEPPPDVEPVMLPQVQADPPGGGPSALDDMNHPDFPEPLIDTAEVISGGPPPDGIPAIDEPKFVRASAVDWLGDTEPVLSLTVGGETRAYPIQIMTWHEIVNDTVGEVPVAVTYCPLCNSGVAFERRVTGAVLSFGTSGRLYENNLVMYDRQTESLWPQLTGQAAVGQYTGTRLSAIPIGAVAWRDFRAAHPEAWVLSRDTGYRRDYGVNPYAGYDAADGQPYFGTPDDDRLPTMERVVGIVSNGAAVAIPRQAVAASGVFPVSVGGRDLVVWHRAGQASALDSREIASGKEIGSVAVFTPGAAGQRLDFQANEEGFVDLQTGSTWDIFGQASSGPLAGSRLEPHTHLDTFWFAWVAFQPDTTIER